MFLIWFKLPLICASFFRQNQGNTKLQKKKYQLVGTGSVLKHVFIP